MQDLLSSTSDSIDNGDGIASPKLSTQFHHVFGVCIPNLTVSPPLSSASSFDQLVTAGLDARCVSDDSNDSNSSSVFLRVSRTLLCTLWLILTLPVN